MSRNLFDDFVAPDVDPLSAEDRAFAAKFCVNGFGFSEWSGRAGASKNYYFNFDRMLTISNPEETQKFVKLVVTHLRNVASSKAFLDGAAEPVIAYGCPGDSPVGSAQLRVALAEHLEWRSVIVSPDKQLLRSRIVGTDSVEASFPDSIRWLSQTRCIIVADAATTGGTIAKAVGVLSSFGARAVAALAIYDREEGARESLATIRLPLYTVFNGHDAKQQSKTVGEKLQEGPRSVFDMAAIVAKAA